MYEPIATSSKLKELGGLKMVLGGGEEGKGLDLREGREEGGAKGEGRKCLSMLGAHQ